jgi:hypothetical protein
MSTEKQSNEIFFSFIYIYIYIKEKKISLLCFSVDMRIFMVFVLKSTEISTESPYTGRSQVIDM